MPSFNGKFSKALINFEFLLKGFMFACHLWVLSIPDFSVLIFLFEVFMGHTGSTNMYYKTMQGITGAYKFSDGMFFLVPI